MQGSVGVPAEGVDVGLPGDLEPRGRGPGDPHLPLRVVPAIDPLADHREETTALAAGVAVHRAGAADRLEGAVDGDRRVAPAGRHLGVVLPDDLLHPIRGLSADVRRGRRAATEVERGDRGEEQTSGDLLERKVHVTLRVFRVQRTSSSRSAPGWRDCVSVLR